MTYSGGVSQNRKRPPLSLRSVRLIWHSIGHWPNDSSASICACSCDAPVEARVVSPVRWISSGQNALADAPSRGDADRFVAARAQYLANLPPSRPNWFPADIPFRPEGARSFAVLGAGSQLYDLAVHLGFEHDERPSLGLEQVEGILQSLRREFIVSASGGH